ncbi:MAG: tetratricopeptide repeat protein [Oscillospiraceae bacterium]
MQCAKCGKSFDESITDVCGYCRTRHTKSGEPIRDIGGVLKYISANFGEETLLDRRRTDALIADLFPKESAVRRLAYIALYDGCAKKLAAVKDKPFEVRSAAAARCVKSLRDEIGLKGRPAAEAVEAVGNAVGCEIAFIKPESAPASVTESRKNITDSAEQYSLGRHFDRRREYEKAMYWFAQAAMQDMGEAQYYVGYYLLEGRGGEQDCIQAREWFLRGAENGVAAAQYMTGYFYAEGIGCGIDEAQAFGWFLKAARAGYDEAVNVIALCYENGVYVEKNPEIARRWRGITESEAEQYTEAEAPQPTPENGAEEYLAARRYLDEGDYEGAARFYKCSAELGYVRAMCSYGKCLYLGVGTEKDEKSAFEWFSRAAERNHGGAQYNLGVMYLKGVSVEKNKEKALELFEKAAENGSEEAAKALKKIKPT